MCLNYARFYDFIQNVKPTKEELSEIFHFTTKSQLVKFVKVLQITKLRIQLKRNCDLLHDSVSPTAAEWRRFNQKFG